MSGEKICVASKSEVLIDYVCKRLEEIGAQNKTYKAHSVDELEECLTVCCPRILIIEASFWFSATPQEILSLLVRFNRLSIYAFGAGDYTDKFIWRIIHAGAYGFLTIRKGRASFRNDLKDVLKGNMVVPPDIEDDKKDVLPETSEKLTPRDLEIIHLLLEEMDNRTIAETLNVKEQAVRNRRSMIYAKVNVDNIVGLIKCLFRKKIITVNEFLAS